MSVVHLRNTITSDAIKTHPKVAVSSAGGPPVPFSVDIINGILVDKRLETRRGLLLRIRLNVRDVLARKWVTRHDSMQRKDFTYHTREIFSQA